MSFCQTGLGSRYPRLAWCFSSSLTTARIDLITNFLLLLGAALGFGATKRSDGAALGGKTVLFGFLASLLRTKALDVPTRPWASSALSITELAPLSDNCQRELRSTSSILLDLVKASNRALTCAEVSSALPAAAEKGLVSPRSILAVDKQGDAMAIA